LNKLIISNNDRIKGYQAAAKETEEQDFKSLFTQLITTSQKCNQELIRSQEIRW
jgi:rubrerythrin